MTLTILKCLHVIFIGFAAISYVRFIDQRETKKERLSQRPLLKKRGRPYL